MGVLLISCTPKFFVTNIRQANPGKIPSIVYALPQTGIRVQLNYSKETFKRGPYYQFADKYLGYKDVLNKDYIRFKIESIQIETFETIDTGHFYSVWNLKSFEEFHCLCKKGLVKNLTENSDPELSQNFIIPESKEIIFKDNTMKKNLSEKEETVYKTIYRDSLPVLVSSREKRIGSRSLEDKSKEAADIIIRLRKREFKLIAGIEKTIVGDKPRQYAKQYPDGEAIKYMVKELDSLENELIEMFIGKSQKEYLTNTFSFVPSKNFAELFVCSFDENNGISTTEDKNSIILRINQLNRTTNFKQFLIADENLKYKGLVYRIPDAANAEIHYKQSLLFRKQINVFQYSPVISVPTH